MTALHVDAITKRFGATTALDGVTLTLQRGEVRGLLGPNGAGKTTLLRTVLGLVGPDEGAITAGVHPVAGFVGDPAFYPYLSGRANLELQAELDRGVGYDRIDDVLDQVGLADRAAERFGGYSSGMRQRLGIAAALLREPRLLILDEPTSALDPAGAERVLSRIRQLASTGVATLIASHQLDALDGLCDSYTVLDRGRVVWDGSAAQRRLEAPSTAYRLRTSDDRRARELAQSSRLRLIETPAGVEVSATEHDLDAYVAGLVGAGIAVRRLQPVV